MADRIEREIDEILRKIDDFIPEGGRPKRETKRVSNGLTSAQTWLGRRLAAISLNQVMLWTLLLFIGAFFFRGIPGASWVMIGALIVFATAFVLSLKSPGGRSIPEKRWRGQPVDYSGPAWPTKLKSWIKGRKKT